METQYQDEWNRIQSVANQKLSNHFAAGVVLRAQKERRSDRQRDTMLAVYCFCLLCVLGTTWALRGYESLKNESQWQCLYVENEVMRTSI